MGLNISIPISQEEKRLYLGETIPEFVTLFRKHLRGRYFDLLSSRKEDVMGWLSQNCSEEVLKDSWQFFDNSPEQFALALDYLHRAKTGKKLSLEQFAGYREMKEYLNQYLIPFVSSRHKYRETFNLKSQEGLLLYGPPGCGKSYLSKCIADEMGYCFIDPSPVLLQTYDGLEMLPHLFGISRRIDRAVLYFDDLDKLCASRESLAERITSAFLSQMDGYNEGNYLMMGSTNYPERIDSAFYRPGRFGQVKYMGLPTFDTRMELFKFYSNGLPLDSPDFKELAEKSEYCSCADIKYSCRMAAFHACQESIRANKVREITQDALLAHIRKVNPSGINWLEQKLSVNFGPFAELFPDLIKDLERYKEKRRCLDVR